MYEVVYYALCGNNKSTCQSTRELAEAIAGELGVKAEDIRNKEGLTADTLVFLGSSCYGGREGSELSAVIEGNDFKGKQVALFGTTLNGKVRGVEELVKPTGALIKGNFICQRKALPFLHKAHASDQELTSARDFVNKMKNS